MGLANGVPSARLFHRQLVSAGFSLLNPADFYEAGMPKRATHRSADSSHRGSALQDLIRQHRQKLAIAAACYAAADKLLDGIRKKLKVNRRVAIGNQLYAVLVDLLDDDDRIFKPVIVKRYELQIQDAAGNVVRSKKARSRKA